MNTPSKEQIANYATKKIIHKTKATLFDGEVIEQIVLAAIDKATEHLHQLLYLGQTAAQPQPSRVATSEPTCKCVEQGYPDEWCKWHGKAASSEPPKEWQHKIADFVNLILHGDDEHRKWLREAGEAFILGQPMPPARHKRFSCAYCYRGMEAGVNLLRVNKLGDTPAVWICTEHFNYDDWKNAR